MRSLPSFIVAMIGVTLLWGLSAVVPFIVLAMPNLEGMASPNARELALLACCYGGGAVFWVLVSSEIAALVSRPSIVGWTAFQTAVLLIALPLVGNSMPMLMALMAGLGCMTAVIWAVWFPLLLEVDYRIRPGVVAAFFVALYSSVAIGIPVSVQMVKNFGPLRTLMAFGGVSMLVSFMVIATSKKMLKASRALAPSSFLRFDKEDIRKLFNLSFILVCLIVLPAFAWVLQTMEQGFLTIGMADKLHIDQLSLLWIVGIARAPALAVLLMTMPTIRNGVPVRYFALGLLVSGGALPVVVYTTNAFVFTGAYVVCFAGIGLGWGAFFATISAAVPRETRCPGFIVAAMALVGGLLAASGWQWLSHFLNLDPELVFSVTAIGVGAVGMLALAASFIAKLNGSHQGGHSEEDRQPSQANFRKFTYGNPTA